MLNKCICVEFLKLRRSKLWIVLFILPIISCLMGVGNFYMNQSQLRNEWYSLWTQISLFYTYFFYPALIAICCSFICRLEHNNKNWNRILTIPVSIRIFFASKLFTVSILMLIVQILLGILFCISGFLLHFTEPIPAEMFGWLIRGWIASITIATIQLTLSINIRSFAVPIAICICLSIGGVLFYLKGNGMLFPYSLPTIGMGSLNPQSLPLDQSLKFILMNLIFIIVFQLLEIGKLTKQDIHA